LDQTKSVHILSSKVNGEECFINTKGIEQIHGTPWSHLSCGPPKFSDSKLLA